jgi:hypothetical protein
MNNKAQVCLEPFSGSGTTALELQNIGIKCYSFEVNPLMYLIAKTKLESNYHIDEFKEWFIYICNHRMENIEIELSSEFGTLYQDVDKKRWNYNTEIGIAVEKLRRTINTINNEIYKELFTVALASILLDVSNLYRNGKCLSYKKNWKDRKLTEEDVFNKFGYSEKEGHILAHQTLTEKVVRYKEKYESGETILGVEMLGFLKDWLIGHIVGVDKRYQSFFIDHGIK